MAGLPYDPARFVRQVLLREIGPAGQARICAARARVAGAGPAHEVARAYAEAAGFGGVEAGELDLDRLAPAAICRTPEARDVLGGARAALAEIRRAVGAPAGGAS